MLTAIDIGNTSIKTGVFDGGELTDFRAFNDYIDAADFIVSAGSKEIAISSVVPVLSEKISGRIKQSFGITPFIINRSAKFNLKINYDSAETLGIDRICSAEGALFLTKKSGADAGLNENSFIVSMDLGTATTLNIVKWPDEFVGGMISPGIKMMFGSLNKNTAQLPEVDSSDFKNFIGSDTKSSIAAGVLGATAGLAERTEYYLRNTLNAKDVVFFITGGNAEKIINHLNIKFTYVKELVLTGINAVYYKNFSGV